MSGPPQESPSPGLPQGGFAAMVPELDVSDLRVSIAFWCDVLGFEVAYARPEAALAYLEREGAQIMLNAISGRWQTGALDRPFGRGVNLQVAVSSLDPILERLETARLALFELPHEAWYRAGNQEVGLRQCLVQDPDGYLIRLAEPLGLRDLSPGSPASSP